MQSGIYGSGLCHEGHVRPFHGGEPGEAGGHRDRAAFAVSRLSEEGHLHQGAGGDRGAEDRCQEQALQRGPERFGRHREVQDTGLRRAAGRKGGCPGRKFRSPGGRPHLCDSLHQYPDPSAEESGNPHP